MTIVPLLSFGVDVDSTISPAHNVNEYDNNDNASRQHTTLRFFHRFTIAGHVSHSIYNHYSCLAFIWHDKPFYINCSRGSANLPRATFI
jgi:hypothetical protein